MRLDHLSYLRDLVAREKHALSGEITVSNESHGQVAAALGMFGLDVDPAAAEEAVRQVEADMRAVSRQELVGFLDGLVAREERRLASESRGREAVAPD